MMTAKSSLKILEWRNDYLTDSQILTRGHQTLECRHVGRHIRVLPHSLNKTIDDILMNPQDRYVYVSLDQLEDSIQFT